MDQTRIPLTLLTTGEINLAAMKWILAQAERRAAKAKWRHPTHRRPITRKS